jgi:hypothetical protein
MTNHLTKSFRLLIILMIFWFTASSDTATNLTSIVKTPDFATYCEHMFKQQHLRRLIVGSFFS